MSDEPEYVLNPDEAKRSLRIVRILLLLSLPVYALFVAVATPPPQWDPAQHPSWPAVYIIGAIGVGLAAAIPLMRKWMFFGRVERGDIEERTEQFLAELRTTQAATWAMATALSILGVVAYLFVYQLWVFGLFFIPSVALFFVYRTPTNLIERMELNQ